MLDSRIGLLIIVVYSIVETLEKFGLKKKYAHLLSIPLGILGSFFYIPSTSIRENIIYGIFVALISIGACDTFCNIIDTFRNDDP